MRRSYLGVRQPDSGLKLFEGLCKKPLHVVAGNLRLTLGGGELTVGPGTVVCIPTGVVHTGGASVKFLGFDFPAGLKGYFKEVASLMDDGPPDPSQIAALSE